MSLATEDEFVTETTILDPTGDPAVVFTYGEHSPKANNVNLSTTLQSLFTLSNQDEETVEVESAQGKFNLPNYTPNDIDVDVVGGKGADNVQLHEWLRTINDVYQPVTPREPVAETKQRTYLIIGVVLSVLVTLFIIGYIIHKRYKNKRLSKRSYRINDAEKNTDGGKAGPQNNVNGKPEDVKVGNSKADTKIEIGNAKGEHGPKTV